MRYSDICSEAQLDIFMTTPSLSLLKAAKKIKGDVMGLGATGKMGIELIRLIQNADRENKTRRRYFVASTFSNPENIKKLEMLGIKTFKGDLSDTGFLNKLPEVKNIYYMAGFKFGSSGGYQKAYHMNVIMPYLAGERFKKSDITCFSTCNFYPHVERKTGGAREATQVEPKGIYGWTALGRENAFKIVSEKYGTKIAFYRLAYAQHLYYGVLIDIAKMVKTHRKIQLTNNYVNLVFQRDANEVAIKCMNLASAPPAVINCAGSIVSVKEVIARMARIMGRKVDVSENKVKECMIHNDDLAVKTFGPYRDKPAEMIEAAALWVKNGGKDWNKPTGFLSLDHKY